MNVNEVVESIPDSAKVVLAGGPPVVSFFGIPVEQWSFILSGVVALLFIVEKLYRFYRWYKDESAKSK